MRRGDVLLHMAAQARRQEVQGWEIPHYFSHCSGGGEKVEAEAGDV